MTDFNRTNWAKTEFSRNYLEKADVYPIVAKESSLRRDINLSFRLVRNLSELSEGFRTRFACRNDRQEGFHFL